MVYDHTDKNKLYDLLRSTKYFGSMVWYLISVKGNITGLLKDMLSKDLWAPNQHVYTPHTMESLIIIIHTLQNSLSHS